VLVGNLYQLKRIDLLAREAGVS